MNVDITDPTSDDPMRGTGDFDELWAEMGKEIKFKLQTYDPTRTWLNLYLSHDGKPSFMRTISRKETPYEIEKGV